MTYTYLAAPYSDPCPMVRAERMRLATRAAATLMLAGTPVYSPLTHSAGLLRLGEHELPKEHAWWMRHCRPLVEAAGRVLVLMLPGWEESVGVQMEIAWARERGISVEYIAG